MQTNKAYDAARQQDAVQPIRTVYSVKEEHKLRFFLCFFFPSLSKPKVLKDVTLLDISHAYLSLFEKKKV